MIKKYLKTFEDNFRTVFSLIFITSMSIFFYILYSTILVFDNIKLNDFSLIILSLLNSSFFFISIDVTAGIGREYLHKGYKNLLWVLPLWLSYFIANWLLFS
jgi:hypothetical protein